MKCKPILSRLARFLAPALLAVSLSAEKIPATSGSASASPNFGLNDYLKTGALEQGIRSYQSRAATLDDADRFSLALLQCIYALEGLARDIYRVGIDPELMRTGRGFFSDLPTWISQNDKPNSVDYQSFREIITRLQKRLREAEGTLDGIGDKDFGVVVQPLLMRMDFVPDGKVEDHEYVAAGFAMIGFEAARAPEAEERLGQVEIRFDRADAHWLRGYCNLLLASTNLVLAHDFQKPFDLFAHQLFLNAETPYAAMAEMEVNQPFPNSGAAADFIAALLRIDLEVIEPERLQRAHQQLLTVIRASRLNWEAILAETDNDREWIPGPQQETSLPLDVDDGRVEGWRSFLREAEALLEGDLLIPHWRIGDGRGINLKRAMLEPRRFDLLLWAHGAAALPYLERGELMTRSRWEEITQEFDNGRDFLPFALIVN